MGYYIVLYAPESGGVLYDAIDWKAPIPEGAVIVGTGAFQLGTPFREVYLRRETTPDGKWLPIGAADISKAYQRLKDE